ncbi:hypothetical protein J437_LFUL002909 [Ladona fulva]|uniref:Protein takeout n=1 Tax=Ladona fulva TaxID=123851 RepID=A0A8K0KPL2_LADFU|nr:hypothetical protein J437_LFUL002909 [Ladona fulva]
MVLPSISTASNYEMEGKILLLPITGSGKSYGNYSDISATATVKSEKVKRSGLLYYSVRNFDINFDVGHASVRMNNLFGGNKVAGDAMNAFLNENWQLLFGEMKPHLEKTVASVFKDISNKIFERFPVNDLFKP